MRAFHNLIDGQWVSASDGAVFEDHNPAQKEDIVGTFPSATRADVRRAIAAARAAVEFYTRTKTIYIGHG